MKKIILFSLFALILLASCVYEIDKPNRFPNAIYRLPPSI